MTTDAVAIIHNRFIAGRPELEAYVVEELERIHIGNQIYDLRTKAGMTQSALARKIGMKAVDIDRLENADYEGHPLPTLRRIAAVFGMRIELNFAPLEKKKMKTASKTKSKS
jgi:transcriptional regulator with XRE-family HTH domain